MAALTVKPAANNPVESPRTLEQFLANGKTILFVSHSSASVRDVCRRVCLLEHGHLLFDGPVDEGLEAYRQLMLTPPTPVTKV